MLLLTSLLQCSRYIWHKFQITVIIMQRWHPQFGICYVYSVLSSLCILSIALLSCHIHVFDHSTMILHIICPNKRSTGVKGYQNNNLSKFSNVQSDLSNECEYHLLFQIWSFCCPSIYSWLFPIYQVRVWMLLICWHSSLSITHCLSTPSASTPSAASPHASRALQHSILKLTIHWRAQ